MRALLVGRSRGLLWTETRLASRVTLQPVLCTPADHNELLHWNLNCMVYQEPLKKLMGITAKEAYPHYSKCIQRCIDSGLTFKLIDEHGLFSGFRLTAIASRDEPRPSMPAEMMSARWKVYNDIYHELYMRVWELNPEAQRLVHYYGALIVPAYHGRTSFPSKLMHIFMDFEKLKADGVYGVFSVYSNPHSIRMALKAGHKVIAKVDTSKRRMPDGSPVPLPVGLDATLLIFRKF